MSKCACHDRELVMCPACSSVMTDHTPTIDGKFVISDPVCPNDCVMGTASITNECVCSSVDDDGTEIPSLYCYDCYQESFDWSQTILEEWSGDEYRKVLVNGYGMGWQRLDGHATVKVRNLLGMLSLDGSYRLDIVLRVNGTGSVTRYSHDEPTGASFTLKLLPPRELLCPDCELPTFDTWLSDIKHHSETCSLWLADIDCMHFENYEKCSCDNDSL